MLFLNLDYQLLLILVLVFSSCLFMSAFAIKSQKIGLKAFEMAFALPLLLTIAAFLVSPHQKAGAQELLMLTHLVLVMLLSAILCAPQESDSTKMFYLLPFILACAVPLIAGFRPDFVWLGIFLITDILLVAINLVFLLRSLFTTEKAKLPAHLGLFMIAASLGIWYLSEMLSAESLFLIGAGYASCTLYVYKNTLSIFFKEYKTSREAMERINTSINSEVIRRVEQIERSNRKLIELSKTDSLTGLYVKTAIMKSLEAALERSPQTAISVLMVDIDKFKQINDSMGHQIGDRCIKSLSSLIQSSFRKDDLMGRYGGDEFMLLLPSATPTKAYLTADRFRQMVESKSVPKMTVSIGIATYPEDGRTSADLIGAADKALYASKYNGRNLVTLYSSIKNPLEQH